MTELQKTLRKIQTSANDAVFNLHIKNAAPTLPQFLQERERQKQQWESQPLPPPPIIPGEGEPEPVVQNTPEKTPLTREQLMEQMEEVLPGGPMGADEIARYMDLWVKENRPEIERYKSEEAVSRARGVRPPEMELGGNPKLYKILLQDPSNVAILREKIKLDTSVNDVQANKFILHVLNTTKGLYNDLQKAVDQQREEERELEQAKQEYPEEWEKEEEPVILPDVGLGTLAQTILIDPRLDREEVFRMWDGRRPRQVTFPEGMTIRNRQDHAEIAKQVAIENEQNYEEMISEAVRQQLAPPSADNPDPRMDFFLKYPQHLLDVIKGDADFQKKVVEKLMSSGKKMTGDYRVDFPKLFNSKKKRSMLNLLAREKGGELQKKLEELVLDLPQQPEMMEWLKRGTFGDRQGVKFQGPSSIFQGDAETGNASENLEEGQERVRLEETRLQKLIRQQKANAAAEKIMDRTSKKLAAIGKYYLQDVVEEMYDLEEASINKTLDGFIDEYKKSPGDQSILSNYSVMEKMRIFASAGLKNLDEIFTNYQNPKKSKRMKDYMIYRNDNGAVAVPTSILQQIFGFGGQESIQDRSEKIEKFKGPVDQYKALLRAGKVKDIFQPSWRHMVNYRNTFNALADAGELKTSIIQLSQTSIGKTIDRIRKEIENDPLLFPNLVQFSNINRDDEVLAREQKMNDFIDMTLEQARGHSPKLMKPYMLAYNRRKELEEKYRGDPNALAVAEKKAGANVNTSIGVQLDYVLPSIVEASKENFSDKAVRGFVDMFDYHQTRISTFDDAGKKVNPLDSERRTNAELYYLAKREDPPEDLQRLFSVSKGGGQAAEIQKIQLDLDRVRKQLESRQNAKAEAQADYQERLDSANRKLYDKVGRGVGSVKRENNIAKGKAKMDNPVEGEAFEAAIRKWIDGGGMGELPYKYYFAMGQIYAAKIQEAKDRIKAQDIGTPPLERKELKSGEEPPLKELGISELEALAEKKLRERDKFLADMGIEYEKTSMDLSMMARPRFLKRLKKLGQIRRSNYKFANTSTIDETIERVISEYDRFFISLFPRLS